MSKAMRFFVTLLVLSFPLLAAGAPGASRYLFVWAMQAKHPLATVMEMTPADIPARRSGLGLGKDFLAVFDVGSGSSFGKLVALLPVGDAVQAHHTNYAMPANEILYANDWLANSTYVFDLHDPVHPRLVRKFGNIGDFGYPHSFAYLANGDTLATIHLAGNFAGDGNRRGDCQGPAEVGIIGGVPRQQ